MMKLNEEVELGQYSDFKMYSKLNGFISLSQDEQERTYFGKS